MIVCKLFNRDQIENGCKFMNEEFDVVQSELSTLTEVEDIWQNPVVQALYGALNIFPPLATMVNSVVSKKLSEHQERKQEELCRIIFADNGITLDSVQNVAFIMEYARMLDVVNRLATNEKVKYIANLFKRTFSNGCDPKNIPEFEEYLHRLDYMSYREIDLLFLLYQCEQDPLIHNKKSLSKYDEAWDKFKEEAAKIYDIDENIIVSMISGLTMTGFCREIHFMVTNGGMEEDPFTTTKYFARFLELIE